MQYAQIAVNTKTSPGSDIFTYKISPSDLPKISRGILVSVPFHGRNLEGIVIDIKKSLPNNLSADKLKSISEILDSEPAVDGAHLELAQWISKYYLTSLGETLFASLVPIAKRQLPKYDNDLQLAISKKIKNDKRYATSAMPILLHADFETRFNFYLKKIKKCLNRGLEAIVVVPDLSFLEYFKRYLPKEKYIILSSSQTLTQRYIAWQEIRAGKYPIVLGSASALFAPCQKLGLIICDQEESAFYKNDQSPRWHIPTVAQELSKISSALLILGSITPSIESYYKAKNNSFKLISREFSKIPTKIIDLDKEKRIISYQLETAIGSTLTENGKVILYVNRKGEGRMFSCSECGHTFLCSQCATPLTPQKNNLKCNHCTTKGVIPTKCPNCGNVDLKISGITTDKVKHLIEKIYPAKKILVLEKETADSLNLTKKSLNKIFASADIIIGTFYLAKSQLPKANLVGIVCADQSLSLPDFRIQEKTFDHLLQIIRLGKNAIIQTFSPEHAIFKALEKNSYEDFYNHEIKDRHTMNYPPFSKIIRIIYQHPDEEKCQKEIQNINLEVLKQSKLQKKQIEILGPSAAFYKFLNRRYRYHIIVKTKNDFVPDISKFDKGTIVDIEPQNML